MMIEEIGEVIAERVLKRSMGGGDPNDVVVRLGKPRPFPDDSEFFSPYEVIGLGERIVQHAAGVDAFQSLQLVPRKLSVLLPYYRHEPGLRCSFWSQAMTLDSRKSGFSLCYEPA